MRSALSVALFFLESTASRSHFGGSISIKTERTECNRVVSNSITTSKLLRRSLSCYHDSEVPAFGSKPSQIIISSTLLMVACNTTSLRFLECELRGCCHQSLFFISASPPHATSIDTDRSLVVLCARRPELVSVSVAGQMQGHPGRGFFIEKIVNCSPRRKRIISTVLRSGIFSTVRPCLQLQRKSATTLMGECVA